MFCQFRNIRPPYRGFMLMFSIWTLHLMKKFFTIVFNFHEFIFGYAINIRFIYDGEIYSDWLILSNSNLFKDTENPFHFLVLSFSFIFLFNVGRLNILRYYHRCYGSLEITKWFTFCKSWNGELGNVMRGMRGMRWDSGNWVGMQRMWEME